MQGVRTRSNELFAQNRLNYVVDMEWNAEWDTRTVYVRWEQRVTLVREHITVMQ